jgi:lipopolysaccharide/colanic/teichoic acid biosynthesis glycosyltransferase/RimJ/RimL family protein N-acetyltransferase
MNIEEPHSWILWKPCITKLTPKGVSLFPFAMWWLFHYGRLFTNGDYGILAIYQGEELVHRSCVFPRYFRFPFMARNDLQIGDIWTDPEHRKKGLATLAILKILELESQPGRRFWYVVEKDNIPSIRVIEKTGFSMVASGIRTRHFGIGLLGCYMMKPFPSRMISGVHSQIMGKRLFDLSVSVVGLIILFPALILLAWFVKREDHGPVFYRGERVGKDGVSFRIFKLRTMVVDAEKKGGSSTAADDPRLTRIGRKLRKYKLDELPQLLNVFKGDMSIVGPRPEVRYYTDMFTDEEKSILSVRPGITDWASIWNPDEGALLSGAEDPEEVYSTLIRPTKLKLQLKYVQEQSLAADLKIIFQTLLAIVRHNRITFPDRSEGRTSP